MQMMAALRVVTLDQKLSVYWWLAESTGAGAGLPTSLQQTARLLLVPSPRLPIYWFITSHRLNNYYLINTGDFLCSRYRRDNFVLELLHHLASGTVGEEDDLRPAGLRGEVAVTASVRGLLWNIRRHRSQKIWKLNNKIYSFTIICNYVHNILGRNRSWPQ